MAFSILSSVDEKNGHWVMMLLSNFSQGKIETECNLFFFFFFPYNISSLKAKARTSLLKMWGKILCCFSSHVQCQHNLCCVLATDHVKVNFFFPVCSQLNFICKSYCSDKIKICQPLVTTLFFSKHFCFCSRKRSISKLSCGLSFGLTIYIFI